MRNNLILLTVAASLGAVSATASAAGYFDGQTPLLCSVYQLFECDHPNACQAVSPGEIAGVSHLDVNFSDKIITRAGVDSPPESQIQSVSTDVDGKLIMQGVEDGQAGVRDGAGGSPPNMNPEGPIGMAVAGDSRAVVWLGHSPPRGAEGGGRAPQWRACPVPQSTQRGRLHAGTSHRLSECTHVRAST